MLSGENTLESFHLRSQVYILNKTKNKNAKANVVMQNNNLVWRYSDIVYRRCMLMWSILLRCLFRSAWQHTTWLILP